MTAERRLLIAAGLLDSLRAEAMAARPRECCGLLVGRRRKVAIVTRLEPAANVHDQPTRHFTIDPARHIALLRQLRDDPELTLLGHYHSHPDGPAAPSPRDLAAADDPDMIWLVIDAAGGAIGAFRPVCDQSGRVAGFTDMQIIATPSQNP